MRVERYRIFQRIRFPKSEGLDRDLVVARFKVEAIAECLRKYPTNDIATIRFDLTEEGTYDTFILETDIGVIINEEFREDTKLDEN